MTQEQKELLFKEPCARWSYGVKGIFNILFLSDTECCKVEDFKPYLRPMSSMTDEEFTKLKEYRGLKYDQLDLTSFQNGAYKMLNFSLSEVPSCAVSRVFDWLNKYHFDYRDLIQLDLAIAVTKENNPYKE